MSLLVKLNTQQPEIVSRTLRDEVNARYQRKAEAIASLVMKHLWPDLNREINDVEWTSKWIAERDTWLEDLQIRFGLSVQINGIHYGVSKIPRKH